MSRPRKAGISQASWPRSRKLPPRLDDGERPGVAVVPGYSTTDLAAAVEHRGDGVSDGWVFGSLKCAPHEESHLP